MAAARMRDWRARQRSHEGDLERQVASLRAQLVQAQAANEALKQREQALQFSLHLTEGQPPQCQVDALELAHGNADTRTAHGALRAARSGDPSAAATLDTAAVSGSEPGRAPRGGAQPLATPTSASPPPHATPGSSSCTTTHAAAATATATDTPAQRCAASAAFLLQLSASSPMQMALLRQLHATGEVPGAGSVLEAACCLACPELGAGSAQEHRQHLVGLVQQLGWLLLRRNLGPNIEAQLRAVVVEAAALLSSVMWYNTAAATGLMLASLNSAPPPRTFDEHTVDVAQLMVGVLRPEQLASLVEAVRSAEGCLAKAEVQLQQVLGGDGAQRGTCDAVDGAEVACGGGEAGLGAGMQLLGAAAGKHARTQAAYHLLNAHVMTVLDADQLAQWLVYAYPCGPHFMATLQVMAKGLGQRREGEQEPEQQHTRVAAPAAGAGGAAPS